MALDVTLSTPTLAFHMRILMPLPVVCVGVVSMPG